MIQNDYIYTRNWFGPITNLLNHIDKGTNEELHILEVGSFEGKSTVWFLDNFINNENSSVTCIDPWMNYYQNSDSFNSYDKDTKTWSGIDYVTGGVKDRFLHNIGLTKKDKQVNIIQELSHIQLPKMMESHSNKFDIIYIDGNHTTPFVLTDALMSWYLLKPNGIMIFDDYEWGLDDNIRNRPKLAVDSFVDCFKDYLEVLWSSTRYGIRKK